MRLVYEVTTKYISKQTIHNHNSYMVIASNMNEAIKKTRSYLKKTNSGSERADEVRFVCEIDI